MKKVGFIIIVLIIVLGCSCFFKQKEETQPTVSQNTEEKIENENDNKEEKTEPKEDIRIKMTAIGDIMCHNTQYNDAYNKNTGTYDFSYVFSDIKQDIESADIAI